MLYFERAQICYSLACVPVFLYGHFFFLALWHLNHFCIYVLFLGSFLMQNCYLRPLPEWQWISFSLMQPPRLWNGFSVAVLLPAPPINSMGAECEMSFEWQVCLWWCGIFRRLVVDDAVAESSSHSISFRFGLSFCCAKWNNARNSFVHL